MNGEEEMESKLAGKRTVWQQEEKKSLKAVFFSRIIGRPPSRDSKTGQLSCS